MKRQLYIDTAHTNISVKDGLFFIWNKKVKRQISPKRIENIAITSNVQLNVSAIKLATQNGISIFIYDRTGNCVGQFESPLCYRNSALRWEQLAFMNGERGREWAKEQLVEKVYLQAQNIKKWAKCYTHYKTKLLVFHEDIESYLPKIKATDVNTKGFRGILMGYEGSVARQYYKAMNLILPKEYQFAKRSRQPAEDYFNVALNYLYGISYGEVDKSLRASDLDVFCGVLHCTTYGRNLVFDCIEPLRPIVDRLLVAMCIEKLLNDSYFIEVQGGYRLNSKGKKVLLPAFSDYMLKRIKWGDTVSTIRNHLFVRARKLKLLITEEDKLQCI